MLCSARIESIVTPVAGTTRDVIEESISLDGLPAVLWDTAGIRESDDQIERIGVDLSRQHVSKADAVLVVLDGSEPLATDDELLLAGIPSKKILVAVNKSDLPQRLDADELTRLARIGRACDQYRQRPGKELQQLKKSLRDLLIDSEMEAPLVITNLRHRSALERSESSLITRGDFAGRKLRA